MSLADSRDLGIGYEQFCADLEIGQVISSRDFLNIVGGTMLRIAVNWKRTISEGNSPVEESEGICGKVSKGFAYAYYYFGIFSSIFFLLLVFSIDWSDLLEFS